MATPTVENLAKDRVIMHVTTLQPNSPTSRNQSQMVSGITSKQLMHNGVIYDNQKLKSRSFGGWGWGGEVAQTMYTHVGKCKNNKIK
jgi:hypothetical protein